jgi:nicotinamide mononucleotide transporter
VTTPLELAANVVMTASILLAGRNSIHTWWSGIVGCALFGLLFAEAKLYADVALQLFFIGTSAIGWHQWLRGNRGHSLAISRAPRRLIGWSVMAGILAALVYGAMLALLTDAYAPFADSAVLSFSVIAQLLLMTRRVQTWPFWLVVNTLAVPLFASRGLYLTSLLYAAYWINALVAWRFWHGLLRPEASARGQPA